MFDRTVTEEDLARLKAERDEANRVYTDALTILDASKQPAPPEVPAPPPSLDPQQLATLEALKTILLDQPAMPDGWRGRIVETAWALVSPALERQQAFNA